MKFDGEQLLDLTGEIFWICDYRFLSLREKPIRSVSPVQAVLFVLDRGDNSNKFYRRPAKMEFAILGKNGRPLTRRINFTDNTASWHSGQLNVFDNEKECRECFAKQAEKILADLVEYEEQELLRIKRIRDTLQSQL